MSTVSAVFQSYLFLRLTQMYRLPDGHLEQIQGIIVGYIPNMLSTTCVIHMTVLPSPSLSQRKHQGAVYFFYVNKVTPR